MDRLQKLIRLLGDAALTNEIARRVFRDRTVQAEVEAANVQRLRERGRNAEGVDGVEIASYRPYAALTKQLKAAQGLSPERVTLRDTGEFHSSIFIEVMPNGIFVDADDEKTRELLEKYGEDVLGLTETQITELAEAVIFATFVEMLRTELGNTLK